MPYFLIAPCCHLQCIRSQITPKKDLEIGLQVAFPNSKELSFPINYIVLNSKSQYHAHTLKGEVTITCSQQSPKGSLKLSVFEI